MLAMPSWKAHSAPSTKLELHLFVHELTGLPAGGQRPGRTLAVQVDWKGNGPRVGIPLRGAKRSHTAARAVGDDGVVRWAEGFQHTCKLRPAATTASVGNRKYRSWIVNLVIQGYGFRSGGAAVVIGKATLDVATYVRDRGQSTTVPLWCFVDGEAARAGLMVTVEFFEPGRKAPPPQSALLRAISLRSFSRRGFSSRIHQRSSTGSSEISSMFSSSQTTSSSDLSGASDEYANRSSYPSHRRGGTGPALLRALSWSNLTSSFRKTTTAGQGKDKRREEFGSSTEQSNRPDEHVAASSTCQFDAASNRAAPQVDSLQSLLKQEQAAATTTTGGLTASPPETQTTHEGRWERRTIRSRDGQMELTTDVFFASIDQRSEAAAGEGACAVLVTVIADWLHINTGRLPDLPQLDELVRQGSLEWRRLCEDASYRSRFADAHFDLETVLEARVRPVMAVTDMSYVGFFRLPTREGTESPDYLLDTVPFEIVWDEATSVGPGEERTYVVGWNDHFFILKATPHAVYIIDTLGERLFEGCDRAYILRFDKESLIRAVVRRVATGEEKEEAAAQVVEEEEEEEEERAPEGQVLLTGLVTGREFIKEFLAAVPLRELQEEIMNGSVSPDSNLLRRMQIEFHYTISL